MVLRMMESRWSKMMRKKKWIKAMSSVSVPLLLSPIPFRPLPHCLCCDDLYSDFMTKLNTIWTGKAGGLLFRAYDMANKHDNLKQSLEKYGEIGLFTRNSPPSIFNNIPTDPNEGGEPYPQKQPMIAVLYDPAVLSQGYRVTAFDSHPLYRYPYTRFYDPGRPCLDPKRHGHAASLYIQERVPMKPDHKPPAHDIDPIEASMPSKSALPNGYVGTTSASEPDPNVLSPALKALEYIGTASSAKMLSSGGSKQDPKLDMFGLSRDSLVGMPFNVVDVANDPVDQGVDCKLMNPRKYQNASGTPALGTLNAWQPYYDSIDTAIAVRNVNMLVWDDKTRLEMMKLWAGGVSMSIWPNKVLCADPKTNKSPVIGFFVAHHGAEPYTSSELKKYGLDNADNIKKKMHDAMDEFMAYYFGDDGKKMIDDLCDGGCVVELFNSVLASQGHWSKGTDNQWLDAVQGVTDYIGKWMTADKRNQDANRSLKNYARQLPAYQ